MVILLSSVDVVNLRYKTNMDILFIMTACVFYEKLSGFVVFMKINHNYDIYRITIVTTNLQLSTETIV